MRASPRKMEPMLKSSISELFASVGFGIAFGLLGALLNSFLLIPIYGQLFLHVGQAAVILCILLRGFKAGLISAIISSLALAFATDNYYFVVLLVGEAIALFVLQKSRFSLLNSDILYWLVIGLPASLIIIYFSTDFPIEYALLSTFKQLLNGVLYTLIASIIFMFLPYKVVEHTLGDRVPKLSQHIYHLLNLSIVLPSLLVALVLTVRTTSNLEKQISSNLSANTSLISEHINNYLDTHLKVVENLAKTLVNSSTPEQDIRSTHEYFPGFISMIKTNKVGDVKVGAPLSLFQKLEQGNATLGNVSDRDYFIKSKQALAPYVSSAFVGRTLGADPIVGLSSPIIQNGEFNGIVEGSLYLPKFSIFEKQFGKGSKQRYLVVTDAQHKLLYFSEKLELETLAVFEPEGLPNRYSKSLKMTFIEGQEYIFYDMQGDYGWHIYVMMKPDVMTKLFLNNLFILASTMLVISILFLLLAKRFANEITLPLVALANNFKGDKSEQNIKYTNRETQEIAAQLNESKSLMDEFSHRLEQQVEAKTAELSSLNNVLVKLAREDTLTQLSNRRYFDEQAETVVQVNNRNKHCYTVAVIDIDDFKQVNDTCGHAVGDKCLVEVSALIKQQFNRSTDYSARYGGDEFVMLLASDTAANQHAKLEQLLASSQQISLPVNNKIIGITISIGAIQVTRNFALSLTELFKYADDMLYKSKAQGKNQLSSAIF